MKYVELMKYTSIGVLSYIPYKNLSSDITCVDTVVISSHSYHVHNNKQPE